MMSKISTAQRRVLSRLKAGQLIAQWEDGTWYVVKSEKGVENVTKTVNALLGKWMVVKDDNAGSCWRVRALISPLGHLALMDVQS